MTPLTPQPTAPNASLTAREFAELGRQFAQRSCTHSPTWAWVDSAEHGQFAACVGYLRASPVLWRTACGARPGGEEADAEQLVVDCDGDTSELAVPPATCRLDLHIVHNASYNVPVLLIQGHDPDGSLWTPAVLRSRLAAVRGSGASLSGSVITQVEHPALHVPFCCVDPCETHTLMGQLLHAEIPRDGMRLDYLSSWWSVLAPLVGARSRSAWYGHPLENIEEAAPPPDEMRGQGERPEMAHMG